jgi:hypothetical protein
MALPPLLTCTLALTAFQLRRCRICLYWIRGGGCAAADVASCRIARLPAGPAPLAARGLATVLARAVPTCGGSPPLDHKCDPLRCGQSGALSFRRLMFSSSSARAASKIATVAGAERSFRVLFHCG